MRFRNSSKLKNYRKQQIKHSPDDQTPQSLSKFKLKPQLTSLISGAFNTFDKIKT